MKRRVVLTGATGMIGIALAENLLARDYDVVAVIRPNSARKNNIPDSFGIHVIELELSEIGKLPGILKEKNLSENIEIFFHLGWEGTTAPDRNNTTLQINNVTNAVNAVDVAAELGCKIFVGAGSQAEYGRVKEGIKLASDTPCFPENGYGIAKFTAGKMTKLRAEQLGMKQVWVRILSIYGPYDTARSLIMSCISKMTAGQKVACTKGEQQWDYLYCKDAAEAIFLAATKGQHGIVYPIGSGKTELLSDYIKTIRDKIDRKLDIGFGDVEYFPGQVMYLCADIDSLKKDTGFEPKYTFDMGIDETLEWYRGINK